MMRFLPFQSVRVLTASSLVLLLSACTLGPNYTRPNIVLPAAYADTAPDSETVETAATLQARWWTLYGDDTLNKLVSAALENNTDLGLALAQIDQVQAALDQVGSTFFPQIDLEAASSRSRSSTLNAQTTPTGTPTVSSTHRLALSTTFELDFWGKLRRASETARAQLLGTRYARDVAALSLVGAVAQSYFSLRSMDAQIAATQATLATREESLTVITSRAEGGLVSQLDVNQAQVARADAALQLRDLQRQRVLLEHQLGLLTGKLDLKIAPGSLTQLPMPVLPPAGLPSSLVERRPDVRQAEQTLIAANAQIGFAQAAQLPSFSLTGNFGASSSELSDILKPGARIWSLGVTGVLPIFDAGKKAARTREAEAVQAQALAAYRKSVETAFKEVADALSNVAYSAAAADDLQIKVEAARNALRLSELRYKAGYAGYLDVLVAQRGSNDAELDLVRNRQAQLLYSIDLMKALGGGWSPQSAVPVARH